MELKIKDLQKLVPIDFNYVELKKELKLSLEKYKGLVVTEDAIVEAKTDRATLNKLSKAINDRKIEIKKEFSKPYTDFETKIKDLLAMIKEPMEEIDAQVKKFEEKKKEDKKEEIKRIFEEVNDSDSRIKLEHVYEESWLNSTVSIKKITEEIKTRVDCIYEDILAIQGFKSEFEVQLEDLYFKTFSLSKVLAEKDRLETLKAEKEAEKNIVDSEYDEPNNVHGAVTGIASPTAEADNPPGVEPEQVLEMVFKVWATRTQLKALGEYLIGEGIKYGKAD